MKVGVISDTHGNLSGFLDAVDALHDTHGVTKLFFLGHAYKDLDRVLEVKKALRAAKDQDDDPTDFVSDLYDVLAQQQGIARKRATPNEMDDVHWIKKHVVRVPAEDEPEALFSNHGKLKEFELVGGRIICAVHNPKKLSKEDIGSANLVLYGMTHLYQVDHVGGRYFLNPGHLMAEPDNHRPPTYGLLDLGDSPRFTVFDLDGNKLLDKPLELEVKRKFSAT